MAPLVAERSHERERIVASRRLINLRSHRRQRGRRDEPVRDAIEMRPRKPAQQWLSSASRLLTLVLAALAVADLMVDAPPLRWASWTAAVVVAGLASLLAVSVAEPAAVDQSRRWHVQAVASAVVMFMLMARGPDANAADLTWLVIVFVVALSLVAMATTYREGLSAPVGALCLTLDAAIVAVTVGLCVVALAGGERVGTAATILGAFAAAAFAIAVATRPGVRSDPRGADALLLGAVLVLSLQAAGDAGRLIGVAGASVLAAPGVALVASLSLARSALVARRGVPHIDIDADPEPESRLRLVPAVAAAAALVVLSWVELNGDGTHTGFFGVVLLFGLIVGRLLLTLVENRQLLQRVERSGLFEEKLRDLGGALVAALDRKNTLELVCRTAQLALGAESVLLWMLDSAAGELEVVEVLSSKRESVLRRRISLDDPTALVARVVRTGAAEIVPNVPSANLSNGFLNVLLHAQTLLAVPVIHGGRVQGVLVCVDSKNPTAYGQRELSKAELLASQVAVALDNAYQHALQRRRLEELTALYQFAQSAHTALSSTEIVRQLLPILKERLTYSFGTIWLRDEQTGTLRLGAGDATHGLRPSALAMRAFVTGEPARAGLGWDTDEPETNERGSQLAVPMVLKRRVVGVVDLESRMSQAFSSTEERLVVALANHAALAVDNLHLLEETRKVEALRELDRMKTELLSTVSHELRTPLGSIKGYATTLLTHGNKLRRDEQREFLEIIDSESDRLRELIENLLDMSRLEAGVLRIDREPARLGRIAQDVVRKVQLAAAQHQLEVQWPDDDPWVNADEKRIYQVLQNLLTNAIKYSPDGGRIVLSARSARRELVVSVTDDGLGMPSSELDRIFDRFHRVGGEVSRRVGGTGLGLAICKGLVEAHGGRIWAESKGEGMGSTFSFTLPLLPHVGDATVPAGVKTRSKGAYDHQEANRSRR